MTDKLVNQMKNTALEYTYKYMKNVPNLDTFFGFSLLMNRTMKSNTQKWKIDCMNPTIEKTSNIPRYMAANPFYRDAMVACHGAEAPFGWAGGE